MSFSLNLRIEIPDICDCENVCACKKGIVCKNKCVCANSNYLKVRKISNYGPKTPDYKTPMRKKLKKSVSFDDIIKEHSPRKSPINII